MTSHTHRPRYADIVATLALLIAVAGSGVAVAAALPKNSVGSSQIKNGAVRAADLDAGSVTSAQVKNDSLTGSDINESSLNIATTGGAVAEGQVSSGNLTDESATCASITYTVPANGYLKITGSASFNAKAGHQFLEATLHQDGTEVREMNWSAGDIDALIDQAQTIVGVIPVTKGTHSYDLRIADVSTADFSQYFDAQVVVEFFPSGTATLRPSGPRH